MTEPAIFKILLKNEQNSDLNFNFPKQDLETVEIIARKFTDIIYESYKRKSCASTSKRHLVLKFINNVCEVPEPHVYEDYIKSLVQRVKCSYPTTEIEEVKEVEKEITKDLKKYGNGFTQRISRYYSRKNAREMEKQNKIDFISRRNQQKLDKKFHLEVKKKYTFNSNENLAKRLIGTDINISFDVQIDNYNSKNIEHRDIEVKLGYAMANMGETDMLTKILQKLSTYKVLNKSEKKFLQYIWSRHYENILNIEEYFHMFYFIFEGVLLKHATELLSIKDYREGRTYIVYIEADCDIAKIRKICKRNYNCYLKLKSLLYELYCISYCNSNVLEISTLIK